MPIINVTANAPVKLCEADGNDVLIVNRDIVNELLIGPGPEIFGNNPNSIDIIDPLGSQVFNGKEEVWGILPPGVNGFIQVGIKPNSSYWAPSPAQVAAQINALGLMKDSTGQAINNTTGNLPVSMSTTGIPLLNFRNSFTIPAQNVASLATITLGPFGFNQPGYDIAFLAVSANNAANFPFFAWEMIWTDSSTGVVVAQEFWSLGLGNVGSPILYLGNGPCEADQLTITIFNPSNFNAQFSSITLSQASRVFGQRHHWTSGQNLNFGVPGFTAANYNPTGNIIVSTAPSIGAGSSANRILPLYVGLCTYAFVGVAGTSGQRFVINDEGNNAVQTSWPAKTIYQIGDTTGVSVGNLALPRSMCSVTIFNDDTVTRKPSLVILAQEQQT